MKEKNFISIYDNALSSEECKFIRDYHDSDDYLLSIRQEGKTLGDTVQKHWKDSHDRYMAMYTVCMATYTLYIWACILYIWPHIL